MACHCSPHRREDLSESQLLLRILWNFFSHTSFHIRLQSKYYWIIFFFWSQKNSFSLEFNFLEWQDMIPFFLLHQFHLNLIVFFCKLIDRILISYLFFFYWFYFLESKIRFEFKSIWFCFIAVFDINHSTKKMLSSKVKIKN